MPRMISYLALLRAVNVGGTGKLPMADLRRMCEEIGLADVETYIASGNVVFRSAYGEPRVKRALETRLGDYAGKPMTVVVRSADEMRDVVRANPFPLANAKATVAIFLDEPPPRSALEAVTGRVDEEIRLGRREIYVAYGASGMGQSKLKIPAARSGTARNMNTIATLAEMAARR